MQITFYFDYVSPYSYLAWYMLPQLQRRLNLTIVSKPVLFAGLLNHWDHKGPAEIPPKRDYIFMQCLRHAIRENISFTLPKFHPFNPITALRLSLVEVAGQYQAQVIRALWQAGWQQGRDLADKDELLNILEANALPANDLLEKTMDPEIKHLLKETTSQAIELGVFGVPTFITDDKTLFWGLDSLVDLESYLKGENLIAPQKLQATLSRQSAATR